MSYDISLVHRDGSEVYLDTPFLPRGGTVPAQVCSTTGQLMPCPTTEASINITYNYAKYYYAATEGDARFLVENEDHTKTNGGIRGLYGKTAKEATVMLADMIFRIHEAYTLENGTWKETERVDTETEKSYMVSEGDTSNYWTATAANAILPLVQILHMSVACMLQDVVWDGD